MIPLSFCRDPLSLGTGQTVWGNQCFSGEYYFCPLCLKTMKYKTTMAQRRAERPWSSLCLLEQWHLPRESFPSGAPSLETVCFSFYESQIEVTANLELPSKIQHCFKILEMALRPRLLPLWTWGGGCRQGPRICYGGCGQGSEPQPASSREKSPKLWPKQTAIKRSTVLGNTGKWEHYRKIFPSDFLVLKWSFLC